jgi:hypothetical protein
MMLPFNRKQKHPHLLEIFTALTEEDQACVLAFAQFLHQRSGANDVPDVAQQVQEIPRPAQESVVGALKRLSATYPMLDKAQLLNDTSPLMSQHLLKGRPAVEVIDALEVLFRQHYHNFSQTKE